jgi:hypothetical protein
MTLTAMLSFPSASSGSTAQGKLAQHDKEQKKSAIAIIQIDNRKAAWPFEKV